MRHAGEFFTYLSVSVGMALAVSCFAVFSLLFHEAQANQIVLAIVIAGVLCLGVAASIAELANRFPSSTGLRTYLKAAFGDAVSLFVVFMYLFLVLLIAGVESYVFAAVVEQFIPDFPRWLTIGLLLGAVITVNLAGVELPGRVQSLLTMLLVVGLLSISLFALQSTPPALSVVAPVTEARWDLLPQIICLAFFMFVGFEWVIQVGRRPAAYQRLIPAAMFVSIVLLGMIYGLFALALDMHLDSTQLSTTQTPQIVLGWHLLGEHGRWLFALLSLLAILTSFNAGILGATRLMYVLARESHLPPWCANISLHSGVPTGAVLALGSAAMVSAILINAYHAYGMASALSAIIICVTYISLLAAAWCLKRREIVASGAAKQNRLPAVVQLLIAIILAGVAAATAFSSPSLLGQCLVVAAIAGGMTWLSLAHAKKARYIGQTLT